VLVSNRGMGSKNDARRTLKLPRPHPKMKFRDMLMKKSVLALLLGGIPWTLAHASFCTTYVANSGPGVCVSGSGTSNQGTGASLAATAVFEANGTGLNVLLLNDASATTVDQSDFIP